jgi:hypothetical protein
MTSEDLRFICIEGVMCADPECWVYDLDQRRWFVVGMPVPLSYIRASEDDETEEWIAMCQRAKELLGRHVDNVATDVTGIKVDEVSGDLTFVTDPANFLFDPNISTHYPLLEEFQLPEQRVKTVLRSGLSELEPLSPHVDLVSHSEGGKGVFKYSHHHRGFGHIWQEIQIHARLPSHTNILPLDFLVLDEITGTRVVGFTTPFIDGGDLDRNRDRPFKLKYLKQLTAVEYPSRSLSTNKPTVQETQQVIDDLNYKYGIAHQDVAPRNIFIDSSTDTLLLFDFSEAARIGYNGGGTFRTAPAREERNDVKAVVLTVHEILTGDQRYQTTLLHDIDEADLLYGLDKWKKHPDVQLDPGLDITDYYNELMRWVRARRERPIKVYAEASELLDWPTELPAFEALRLYSYTREEAEQRGLPYIEWIRPRSAHLDRSRRLLATGKYADEAESNGVVNNEEPVKSGVEDKARKQQQQDVQTDGIETKTAITTTSPSHELPTTSTKPEPNRQQDLTDGHPDQSNSITEKKRAHSEPPPSPSPIAARRVEKKTRKRARSMAVVREEPLRRVRGCWVGGGECRCLVKCFPTYLGCGIWNRVGGLRM